LLNPLGLNEHWSRPSPDPVGRRGRVAGHAFQAGAVIL